MGNGEGEQGVRWNKESRGEEQPPPPPHPPHRHNVVSHHRHKIFAPLFNRRHDNHVQPKRRLHEVVRLHGRMHAVGVPAPHLHRLLPKPVELDVSVRPQKRKVHARRPRRRVIKPLPRHVQEFGAFGGGAAHEVGDGREDGALHRQAQRRQRQHPKRDKVHVVGPRAKAVDARDVVRQPHRVRHVLYPETVHQQRQHHHGVAKVPMVVCAAWHTHKHKHRHQHKHTHVSDVDSHTQRQHRHDSSSSSSKCCCCCCANPVGCVCGCAAPETAHGKVLNCGRRGHTHRAGRPPTPLPVSADVFRPSQAALPHFPPVPAQQPVQGSRHRQPQRLQCV